MTIKQLGGVFGRNPTFNNVTIEGTLTFDGDIDINSDLTISGNLYLPDNSKAIFGDGSDLQIYHDGSNSFIDDAGTGNLQIRANAQIKLQKYTGENMFVGIADGAASMYYDNSQKIATTATGIDVTGSVTADGLTVDGDLAVSAANSRIRLFETDTTDLNTQLQNQAGDFNISRLDDDASASTLQFKIDHATGNVSIPNGDLDVTGSVTADGLTVDGTATFNTGSGTADNVVITSTDSGGSTAPDLVLFRDSVSPVDGDNVGMVQFRGNDDASAERNYAAIYASINDATSTSVDGKLSFAVTTANTTAPSSGTTFMTIDGGGDISFYSSDGLSQALFWDASAESLGIGTTTPSNTQLHVLKAGSDANVTIESTGTGFDARLNLYANSTGVSQIRFGDEADTNIGLLTYDHSDNLMQFRVNDSEAMRIDSSNNLLVGTTSTAVSSSTGSVTGAVINNSGLFEAAKTGTVMELNRLSADGNILNFRKDGTTVGSISVTASATAYNTSSDQRLKENIADADDAGAKIDSIQVRKFDWKADGSHQDYGMVAQELLEVAPEAVSAPEDPEEMMGVDYSKLVPMMLKEIQSLRARIAALES